MSISSMNLSFYGCFTLGEREIETGKGYELDAGLAEADIVLQELHR
jgi:hypothetical protein